MLLLCVGLDNLISTVDILLLLYLISMHYTHTQILNNTNLVFTLYPHSSLSPNVSLFYN